MSSDPSSNIRSYFNLKSTPPRMLLQGLGYATQQLRRTATAIADASNVSIFENPFLMKVSTTPTRTKRTKRKYFTPQPRLDSQAPDGKTHMPPVPEKS
jgi:hypothetical protein